MDLTTYTFILNLIKLIIPILLVIFGFYLILKKVKGNSGEITIGSLSIKNSTAGIVFICCGTLLTTLAINKGNGYLSKRSYGNNDKVIETADSVWAENPNYTEEVRIYQKKMPDSLQEIPDSYTDSIYQATKSPN
ncbi:hypothetical protein [Chryseobacterium chendengshani]|uniref:hypothetical protein n=1 Tax=Chryseobacterium sp. LJ756 TaxID=2864113 RepID=UPI001C63F687|nr:hypothetical protein [Chryseobacterium sp. LJ756]MBW7674139.1 hypothetical protein [Chryseobacterium sp. LJ756]